MFPQVFNSYHSKGGHMNSPTCVAVPPLLHPSTSSRSGGQIPREWQTPGTCTGREPTSTPTSQTMGSPGKTLCSVCQHQGAAGESLERGKHPGHSTMGALHRAGELSPSPLPSLRLCSQSPNPHYLPKIQHGPAPALLPEAAAPLSAALGGSKAGH